MGRPEEFQPVARRDLPRGATLSTGIGDAITLDPVKQAQDPA